VLQQPWCSDDATAMNAEEVPTTKIRKDMAREHSEISIRRHCGRIY
jgi:hypothetical protein